MSTGPPTVPATPPAESIDSTPRVRMIHPSRLPGGWRAGGREFFIILAGVLGALAAQAWWENREERAREREHLQQLYVATRENEHRLQQAIAVDSAAGSTLTLLTGALYGGDALPHRDTLATMFRERAFASSDLQLFSGTYGALIRAGDLRLIRTDTLRAMIVAYDALLDNTQTMLRLFLEQYAHNPAQMARPLPFLRRMFFGPENAAAVTIDFERLRRDPDAEAVFFAVQVANMNRVQHLRRLLAETRRLREALEAEPGLNRSQ